MDSQHRERQCNKGHLFLCKPYIPKVTEERSGDGGTVRTGAAGGGAEVVYEGGGATGDRGEGHACFL